MTTDAVTVSTIVKAEPALAFEVFSGEIDQWWRRGPRYRQRTDSVVSFVDRPTRRLVEVTPDGTIDLGEVTRWDPPALIRMNWFMQVGIEKRAANTVEVRFEPIGNGTRVTIIHSGWVDLEADGAAASIIGLWWSNPLVDFRAACDSRRPA